MLFQYAILGLLANGPKHGYELRTLYESELMPSAKLNYGQVYPALERLQKSGRVEHDVVSQQERPDKKVYALTEEGRQRLTAWLETPSSLNLGGRNETYLKLMLSRQHPDSDPLEVLKAEKKASFALLHETTQARAQAKANGEPLQTVLLLDLAVRQLEAFIQWLDNCDELLRLEEPS